MDKELDPGGDMRVRVNQEGVLEKIPSLRNQSQSEVRMVEIKSSDQVMDLGRPTFWKHFNAFRREYAPKVVGLFEPCISGRQANRVVAKLDFSHSFRVEAQGFSGGIWLLWDLDVDLEILHLSNQFVNGRVRWKFGMSWIHFTIVYASPSSTRRRALWTQLESLNPGATVPWFVGGDFNVILHADERRGGSDSHIQGSRPFADFLFQTGLSYMGFRGPPFTWSRGNLYQRLDRCLANNSWIAQFPKSHVCHLEKNGSDHRPLLLCMDEIIRSFYHRPFRYIFAWQEHPTFSDFLKRTWSGDNSLANANSFINEIKDWNLSVFGNIGKKKKRLLTRLKGIDIALDRSHSDSLVDLGHKLRSELEDVMNQEESLWNQKACANWILKGDHNTSLFIASTMARRRANFISGLKLHGTDWCEEQDELRNAALFFYQELFSSSNLAMIVIIFEGNLNILQLPGSRVVNGPAIRASTPGWQPPNEGCYNLNVDGAMSAIDGNSASGGVIRNHQGGWITGFSKFIGKCSILEAELWGIARGLEVAWDMDCCNVVVESDCVDALKAITRGSSNNGHLAMLRFISDLCHRNWNVSFVQTARNNNGVANRLAKMASEGDFIVKRFMAPPPEILSLLHRDIPG
ncbi:hypothetical protein GQ457_03G016410 [Hibiscus cannabinus]